MEKVYQRNKNDEIAEWAEEIDKLQGARRNSVIYEVLTDDKDYLKVISDARVKLEKDTKPCIVREDSQGKTQACATPTDDSKEQSDSANTGACGNVKAETDDHIAEKGYVGSFQCSLGHKPHSTRDAVKISDAKAAVKTVHFANLMDLCLLKNAELATHLQKFKGRVVLQGRTTSKTKKGAEQYSHSKVPQCHRW